MGFWSTIAYKLKEVLSKMIGANTIEKTLHVTPTISSQMEEAINLWSDMYKGKAPWLREPDFNDPTRIVSLGLPAMIASEKARTALIEFESEITTPTEEVEVENPNYQEPQPDAYGNIVPTTETPTIKEERPVTSTERATFLNDMYKKLKAKLRTQVEYGIAKGGLIIKPYVVANKSGEEENAKQTYSIEWDFCQADSFYPIAFNSSGDITEAAFLQTVARKDVIYRRLEYHKWENNTVTIINKAYKSKNSATLQDNAGVDLGQEVPLTEVPEWADLQPQTKIAPVSKPLFGYFKMPEANTIDTSSPLGVSGYSRAVNLIKDADMQYSRLLWEYEGGELAIDIDRNALDFRSDDKSGRSMMSNLQRRLYRKVDIGVEGNTFNPYAPALRDSSYLQGLNSILMRIEDVVALSRGTLSDAAAEARTATELKILKQRSYQENVDIQHALQTALESAVYAANVYVTLYNIVGDVKIGPDGTPDNSTVGQYEMSFEWDDSLLTDVDSELSKRITLMNEGLVSKIENRMWYFGETERQATEALQKIQAENQRDMENSLIMNMNAMNQQ